MKHVLLTGLLFATAPVLAQTVPPGPAATTSAFNADMPIEAISFYAKRELGERSTKLTNGSVITLIGNIERDQFSRGQPARLRIVALGA